MFQPSKQFLEIWNFGHSYFQSLFKAWKKKQCKETTKLSSFLAMRKKFLVLYSEQK